MARLEWISIAAFLMVVAALVLVFSEVISSAQGTVVLLGALVLAVLSLRSR